MSDRLDMIKAAMVRPALYAGQQGPDEDGWEWRARAVDAALAGEGIDLRTEDQRRRDRINAAIRELLATPDWIWEHWRVYEPELLHRLRDALIKVSRQPADHG